MAVTRRKQSKHWLIEIYQGKGKPRKRFSSGTADKEVAIALEAYYKRALRGNPARERLLGIIEDIAGHDRPRLPLVLVWTLYDREEPNISTGLRSIRKSSWRRFMDWLGVAYPQAQYLDDVSREIAVAYADQLREECIAPKTYMNRRSDLICITKALYVRAGLQENVWTLTRTLSKSGQHGRAFSSDEIAALLLAARDHHPHWYGPSLVALYTGLRLSDIKRLTHEQVEVETLILRPHKTVQHNVTGVIPLHHDLRRYLATLSGTGRLFPELSQDRFLLAHPFRLVLEQAGLKPSPQQVKEGAIGSEAALLTFHCWRHTWRTLLARTGADEADIKRLGAWTTDINLIYNHDVDSLRAAIEGIDVTGG